MKRGAGRFGGVAARPTLAALLVLIAAATLTSMPGASAQTWPEVKCTLYQQEWTEAVARRGSRGLSPEFVSSQQAFIASGCTDQGHVCPRSPEELDLANIMTIRAMNAGTASTFLPFACAKR